MGLFNGIFCTMQTLIQVLLLDSVHSILHPLMNYVGWSWLFFYAYISVAVIVLLNLVTAIIVDNAIAKSRKDERQALAEKESHKKRLLDQFRSLFELIDVDGDGLLTLHEFESAFDVPEVATKLKMLDFDPESLRELFHLLDNGDGSLSLEEFFEGISNMDGSAKAKDSFKLLKVTGTIQRSLQQLANDIQEDHEQILHHTPGCMVLPRTGSLRARSLKNGDSSVVSSPKRSARAMSARSARGEDPASLLPAGGRSPPSLMPAGGYPTSPFCKHECSVGIEDAVSPALGSLRRLPRPLATASKEPLTITRECSVGSEGDESPAMKATRRKQFLGHAISEGTTLTSNEVAEQVVMCNDKVDCLARSVSELQTSVATSVSDLHASVALVLQRLDRNEPCTPRIELGNAPRYDWAESMRHGRRVPSKEMAPVQDS